MSFGLAANAHISAKNIAADGSFLVASFSAASYSDRIIAGGGSGIYYLSF